MMPIIQITPPNIEVIKEKCFTREYYDYDDSHLIYRCSDLGSLKEISNMKKENSDLKQALIDIRKYIDYTYEMSIYTKSVSLFEEDIEEISQIIDKVLGGSNDNK